MREGEDAQDAPLTPQEQAALTTDMVELCALNPPSQSGGLYEGRTCDSSCGHAASGVWTAPPNATCRSADNLVNSAYVEQYFGPMAL